jgi:hypothetical protein
VSDNILPHPLKEGTSQEEAFEYFCELVCNLELETLLRLVGDINEYAYLLQEIVSDQDVQEMIKRALLGVNQPLTQQAILKLVNKGEPSVNAGEVSNALDWLLSDGFIVRANAGRGHSRYAPVQLTLDLFNRG